MPDIVGKLKPPRLSAAPSSPVVGELYYNTGNNTLYWWNGTAWVSASGGASGPGVDFIGSWGSGIAYKQGDVVRYNNNDYMAVNPSTGQVPPTPSTPVTLGIPIVTSLPAGPFDGQEVILVDSLTNPTYNWRFRYNNGSNSAYKWEFVGGSPWLVGPQGSANPFTSPTYIDYPGGPDLVLPRAGEYSAQFGSWVQNQTGYTSQYMIYFVLALAGGARSLDAGMVPTGLYNGASIASAHKWTGAAGDHVKLNIATQNSIPSTANAGWISLTPRRVS